MSHKHGWYELDYVNTFDTAWQNVNDTVERIDYDSITEVEFIEKYEKHYIPVIITGAQKEWMALKKWTKHVSTVTLVLTRPSC